MSNAKLRLLSGLALLASLLSAQAPPTGRLHRHYVSRIDDTRQPYKLNVPASYDGKKPTRLDVILHGRNAKLTDESFFAPNAKPLPPEQDWIELEVYGRGNNAYRWAGETDVFEAIDAVRKEFNIDTDRIVLRGFSMGGAGAWHIGLHYPQLWAAVEAGAGFTDTIVYAKRTGLSPVELSTLHIYDAVDYAPNVARVPTVGYGGEIDPQLRASLNIKEALNGAAGLDALWLVGPQTAHKWHPESKARSEAYIQQHLPRRSPEKYSFLTWTPRYSGGAIEGLERIYEKATLSVDGRTATTSNVSILRLPAGDWTLDGQKLRGSVFTREGGRWKAGEPKGLWKRTGLQGPIDDAFSERFLAIGDGPGLAEFTANFEKYMHGAVRRAAAPTAKDIADSHLILWGTPETNPTLRKVLPKLPVEWKNGNIRIAGQSFDAATHRLVMIYPNPLNPKRYVVLNSGHSFGKADLEGTNALLYPRWGDYAVIESATGQVKLRGLFDSRWK